MKVLYPQTWFTAAGESSCYSDCIIKIACDYNGLEYNLQNIGRAFDKGIDGGYIFFNKDVYRDIRNFTVNDPCGWLKELTGKNWDVRKESADYVAKKNEIEVQFWSLDKDKGAKGIGHFVLPGWCPTQYSGTLKNGSIYSKRIFRRK